MNRLVSFIIIKFSKTTSYLQTLSVNFADKIISNQHPGVIVSILLFL